MLPQPNEKSSPNNDAFTFRLEMLNKELDFIDSSIRKIDDIGNSLKNWAILHGRVQLPSFWENLNYPKLRVSTHSYINTSQNSRFHPIPKNINIQFNSTL